MGAAEAAAKVDWPAIIREAAQSQLGLVALIVIVLGVVAVALFYNVQNPGYKLAAFVLLIAGIGGFAVSLRQAADSRSVSEVNLITTIDTFLKSTEAEKP